MNGGSLLPNDGDDEFGGNFPPLDPNEEAASDESESEEDGEDLEEQIRKIRKIVTGTDRYVRAAVPRLRQDLRTLGRGQTKIAAGIGSRLETLEASMTMVRRTNNILDEGKNEKKPIVAYVSALEKSGLAQKKFLSNALYAGLMMMLSENPGNIPYNLLGGLVFSTRAPITHTPPHGALFQSAFKMSEVYDRISRVSAGVHVRTVAAMSKEGESFTFRRELLDSRRWNHPEPLTFAARGSVSMIRAHLKERRKLALLQLMPILTCMNSVKGHEQPFRLSVSSSVNQISRPPVGSLEAMGTLYRKQECLQVEVEVAVLVKGRNGESFEKVS